jgi:patatin-like phospholipase/acyl hydrolase
MAEAYGPWQCFSEWQTASRRGPVRLFGALHSTVIKILSIDGGGIRGIIPALVLDEIENRTGRPIAELFDLVAGTSTGGILALGLTIPKAARAQLYTARTLAEMYEREGARIFSRPLLRGVFAFDNLT